MFGGGGPTLNGKEEEKQHYYEIEEIYWKIEELNEYREFLKVRFTMDALFCAGSFLVESCPFCFKGANY